MTGHGEKMQEEGAMVSGLEAEMVLLRRHIEMLSTIAREEPIGIISLAEKLEMPQHKVRYSLRVLEGEGIIRPTPRGAVVSGDVVAFVKRTETIMARLCSEAERTKELLRKLREETLK